MNYSIANEISNFIDQELSISILYDEASYALEAETSVDTAEPKKNFGKTLREKVEKIIKEIYAIIDRTFLKLGNILRKLLVTDEGFKKEVRTAIKKNKPLEAIKLITYQYNDVFLEEQMTRMTSVIFGLIKNLKTDYASEKEESDEPMDMAKDKLYKHILGKMGCPSDVTDMNLYFEYLKKGYRVNKKEQLFKASETRVYYNITMEYTKMEQVVHAKETLMKQQVTILKSNLSNITKNGLSDETVKYRALKQSANATTLYNIYSTFLSIYIQFRTEKIMNYRTVMKKLYHF